MELVGASAGEEGKKALEFFGSCDDYIWREKERMVEQHSGLKYQRLPGEVSASGSQCGTKSLVFKEDI